MIAKPALNACLKIGVDTQLFKKWRESGAKPMHDSDLAKLVDCDAVLMSRLLKHMATMNSIKELSFGLYEMTPWTKSLGKENLSGAIKLL